MLAIFTRNTRHKGLPCNLSFSRWAHCVSCGGDLIAPVSRKRSDYLVTNQGAAAQNTSSTEKLLSEMSESQRQALNWTDEDGPHLDRHKFDHQLRAARSLDARKSQICKPCVMSRHGTITKLTIPPEGPPIMGRAFHVIDAMDFPLGVPFSDIKAGATNGDVFVVTRCDLLVPLQSQLAKFKRYAMDTVFKPLGIPESQVHTVSSKHLWNLNKLSESFVSAPKRNYFVGPPNAGKTALVHKLAGTSHMHTGPTTWPVPFTTQYATEFTALPKFRLKKVVDMPSTPGASGLGLYDILSPPMIRKIGAGTDAMHRDPKYLVPPIKARSGQTVSIGGILGLEFPRLPDKQLPIHVFPVINGLTHTEFGQAFRDSEKIAAMNASTDPNHEKMRMHNKLGLQLQPVAQFELMKNGVRQSLVVKGLGFLQPLLLGRFPVGYSVVVHAPKGTEVRVRPEFISYLTGK